MKADILKTKQRAKQKALIFIAFLAAALIAGMFLSERKTLQSQFPLEADAVCFRDTGQYPDVVSYKYAGRIYVPYGRRKDGWGKPRSRELERCVGYVESNDSAPEKPVKDDGTAGSGVRIYTLKGDDDHNFLMEYVETGLMDEPTYLRAVDTKGEDAGQVRLPDYVEPEQADTMASVWK